MNIKKNLLIGAFTNHTWEDVAPFFKSFQQAGFENCDCVMFIGNISRRTIEKIQSCGVKVLEIPAKFLDKRVVLYRFELMAEFLRDNQDKYNMVFTADIRDVIFQQDIFRFYDNSKPFIALYFENAEFFGHAPNRTWLLQRFGQEAFDSMQDRHIICAGTIGGTCREFLRLMELMTENINSDKFPSFDFADQPSLNWLIYHEKIFDDIAMFNGNEDGPIMTLGLVKRKNINLDSNDNILNGKGETAAVVHQYDRKRDIAVKIIDKFCPEIKKHRLYYKSVILKSPGKFWRFIRYLFKARNMGFIKAAKVFVKKKFSR